MKQGDLVKAIEPASANATMRLLACGLSKSFAGIIIDVQDPVDDQKTPRLLVMTAAGEIIKTRVNYHLLEVVNENR